MNKNPITKVGASGILSVRDKILLGLRAKDDPSLPGLWCSPGGGVEFQESIDNAIVREFFEETGLAVMPSIRFTHVGESMREDRHSILIFKMVILAGPLSKLHAGDGFDDVGFFSWDEVNRMMCEQKITNLTKDALIAFQLWNHK